MKNWKFWLGILISVFFLALALRGLNLSEFWGALLDANYIWLIPGVGIYFMGVWVRAWRWHYLLRPIKVIPTRKMFPPVAIGYMGNNIYPARAGEVLRAVVLRRSDQVAISSSLATIIVERIFDGVVMLAFVFLTLPRLSAVEGASGFIGSIADLAIGGAAVFALALLLFLLVAMFPSPAMRLIRVIYNRVLPESFHVRYFAHQLARKQQNLASPWISKLLNLKIVQALAAPRAVREPILQVTEKFVGGLEALRSPANALMVFMTSVVIWLFETGKYWFVMQAFPFEVDFFTLMLMNGIVNLATTIPAAPGYVGTFDLPGIAILGAAGVDQAVATSYTLVLHVALWLPITLLGGYYALKAGIRYNENLAQNEIQAVESAG